jgi:hypothetical protein
MDVFKIAEKLLEFHWSTDKVHEYAKTNGFPPLTDSDLFWGGFVAASAERNGYSLPSGGGRRDPSNGSGR